MIIIEVAIPCPLYHTFDYQLSLKQSIDDLSSLIGARVFVPFGHRKVIGIIVGHKAASDYSLSKLRSVEILLDNKPLFSKEQLALIHWFSEYYHVPIGEATQLFLPSALRKLKEAYSSTMGYCLGENGERWRNRESNQRSRIKWKIVEAVANHPNIVEATLTELIPTFSQHKKILLEEKIIKSIAQVIEIRPISFTPKSSTLHLSDEQQQAVQQVDPNKKGIYLLEGVTGSGKTAVYIDIARKILGQQKQVLFLVPEIGLTPQFIGRMEQELGVPYAVIHSDISDNERLLAWQKASRGEIALIIGTRSALFTRFQNLGLIVVDEAHDSSYVQADGVRYSAHNTAIKYADILNIPIILGTATPSLESIYNVEQKRFYHLILTKRIRGSLPDWHLVDCRKEAVFDGLSQILLDAIEDRLSKKEQSLIFLNRRGYSPAIMCLACGWISECIACSSPLNYHYTTNELRCHHCGYRQHYPQRCPQCKDHHFRLLGVGTQKLEKALADAFPLARVMRFDRDSITNDQQLKNELSRIEHNEVDIIIGTQMLAKGHDFGNITLVALANPDALLFSSDFRAEEKLAQELMQVSGRAGRAKKGGEVIIQTHYPEHEIFSLLPMIGYHDYLKRALTVRNALNLPPFSHQIVLQVEAHTYVEAKDYLEQLLTTHLDGRKDIEYTSVMENSLKKRRGFYRAYSIMQSRKRANLHLCAHHLLLASSKKKSSVRLFFEIDPLFFG